MGRIKFLNYVKLLTLLILCISDKAYAEEQSVVRLGVVDSYAININPVFGTVQKNVDENIYIGMLDVCDKYSLIDVYGNVDTEVFKYACEVINPCMALATSKGEAGGQTSQKGVSMSTLVATNSRFYTYDIDWIRVTENLEQIDELWYLSNVNNSYSRFVENKSAYMPTSYLQGSGGNSLGIGPYQITSSDWDKWTLEDRMSPTKGWLASLRKAGAYWLNYSQTPISDLTIMALLSMSHQGGSIITSDVGIQIIDSINTRSVQDAIIDCANRMYIELEERASNGEVLSADDIPVNKYVQEVYDITGVDFTQWTYSNNPTNTGNYVMMHTLQYAFYKRYYSLEV